MNKQIAYSTITIKSFDAKTRRFSGIASSASPDRMQDVVEPEGIKYKLPIPFLHQHDSKNPVGNIDGLKVIAGKRIEIKGYVARFDDGPPTLKERVDVAAAELESGLVQGLSIGFNPIEYSFIKDTGGVHFTQWEMLELSMVTIPANAEATITAIKSIDSRFRKAASGITAKTLPARAGASHVLPTKGNSMYTQEALAGLQETRATKAKRMEELLQLKSSEHRFTAEERAEFDGLDAEIEDLDDEIRVTQRHVTNIKSAKPVNGGRAPYGFVKKLNDVEEKFKGETGLKRAMAFIVAQKEVKAGNLITPVQVAEERWGKTNPTLVAVMKAAVAGGGTDSGEWGAELAQADTRYTGDFVDYLYALTTFDRLPLKPVPHNVAIKGQDGAFTGYFTGQSKAIKVSKGDFLSTSTVPYKAAGLTVISNELIRDSSPAALDLCGTGLRNAVRQVVDSVFFSFTAISAGVQPAGIFNGLTPLTSNGGDAQSIITDVGAIWAPFIAANNLEGNFFWTMGPATAIKLGLMRNALGQQEFTGVGVNGGTFQGYPVFVTQNMHAGDVALMNGSEIWKIADLGVSLSVSDSAMIEQDGAPQGATDTPVAASATLTSMFQEDSTAIRVIRPISWGKKYASAVAVIGSTTWGAENS